MVGRRGREAMAVKEEEHGTVEKQLCLSSELSGIGGKTEGGKQKFTFDRFLYI